MKKLLFTLFLLIPFVTNGQWFIGDATSYHTSDLGVTLSADSVSAWADQANSNDYTGAAGTRPVFHGDSLVFNGAEFLDLSANINIGQTNSIVIRMRMNDVGSTFKAVLGSQNSNASVLFYSTTRFYYNDAVNSGFASNSALQIVNYNVYTVTRDTLVLNFYKDNTLLAKNNDLSGSQDMQIGRVGARGATPAEFFDGDITDIIMFESILTTAYLHGVNKYLTTKYDGLISYYIDNTNGDDGNAGTILAPWKTFANLDTIYTAPGYSFYLKTGEIWRLQLTIPFSGDANSQMIISCYDSTTGLTGSAAPGAKPIINGAGNSHSIIIDSKSYITIDGIATDSATAHGIYLYSWSIACSNITIQNCDTIRSLGYGIRGTVNTGSFTNVTVTNNTITTGSGNGCGIHWDKGINNYIISNNTIYDSFEDGIQVDTLSNNGVISGNNISGSGENSIDIKDTYNITISKNTCSNDQEENIILHEVSNAPNGIVDSIIVENNTCTLAGQGGDANHSMGIWLYYVDNCIVRYNSISAAYGAGIYVFDNEISANNNKVYYNLIYNCGTGLDKAGIDVEDAIDTKIYNNDIYNQGTTGDGIRVLGNNCDGVLIKNNIIHTAAGVLINVGTAADTNLVSDYNLFYPDGAGQFIWAGAASDDFADWQNDSGQDANGLSSDPLFTDAANDDFTLLSMSPCIDSGIDVGLTVDYLGNGKFGLEWDIGAFESQVSRFSNLLRVKTNLLMLKRIK